MPLLISGTLHMPICGMLELLYVCNTIVLMDLFMDLFMFVCRKSILYIMMGIKLLSLPMPILYSHVSNFSLLFVFNFVIITSLTQNKLKTFNLTMSNSCVKPLYPHCLGMCCELLCIYYYPLSPTYSSSCIPVHSGLVCHILNSSCNTLGTLRAHMYP